MSKDTIYRQDAVEEIDEWIKAFLENGHKESAADACLIQDGIIQLPSAQPEIVRCKDCKFGEQDEVGRWFCRSLGCQIGNEDGSGFCADAERRTDE